MHTRITSVSQLADPAPSSPPQESVQRIAELLSVDPSTLEVTSVEGGAALGGEAHSEEEGHGGAPPTPSLPAGKGEFGLQHLPMSWCCTPVHSPCRSRWAFIGHSRCRSVCRCCADCLVVGAEWRACLMHLIFVITPTNHDRIFPTACAGSACHNVQATFTQSNNYCEFDLISLSGGAVWGWGRMRRCEHGGGVG